MAEPLVRESQKLYALPLSEFTAARNARAKALKPKDPELAASVAALPKPSVAAGALNELVHEDPSEVRALVQSGKRLRQAQEAAVSGKKGADLNEAIAEHRGALDRVQRDLQRGEARAARRSKRRRRRSGSPRSTPTSGRYSNAGSCTRDLAAAGFGLDPALVPARTTPKPKPATKKPAPPKPDKAAERRRREARERLQAAKAALAEAEQRAKSAARTRARARADLERRVRVDEA